MDEIVDVVDEEDNVIGQELRTNCHEKGILHRGANVFVFKDSTYQELLIQKRSKDKDLSPGKFCTPGGHLGQDETYLQGAKREYFEEMHKDMQLSDNIHFEKLFKIKKKTHNNYEFITAFRAVSQAPFNSDPKEVEEYFFEDINKVIKQIEVHPEMFTKTSVILIKEYGKRYHP